MTDDRGPEPGSAEVGRRMAVLRPHLHDAVPLAKVAADAGIAIRTVRRWLARYRADGPFGLARPSRPEAGTRTFPKELVELVEGMALLKPPPSIATIHRRMTNIAGEQGWKAPSRVRCRRRRRPFREPTDRCRRPSFGVARRPAPS